MYLMMFFFVIVNGILLAIVWQEINNLNEVKKSSGIDNTIKNKYKVSLKANGEALYKYSIYLTSDDGPLRGSEYLNEIILRHKVPITLFLVGQAVRCQPEVSSKVMAYRNNKYVMIANHSFSHANAKYKRFYYNSENVVNDFLKNEYFFDIDSDLGRLPGRNVWAINNKYYGKGNALESAKILEQKFSYKIYGWDYEIRHNKKGKVLASASKTYRVIKSLLRNKKTYVQNNIVILMHDQMFRVKKTRKFLEELIVLFKNDKECKFKFMNEYS